MIETAWHLGFRRYAHQLGYGGHPITKLRRYSVTFGYVRRERAEYRKAQRWPDGELDPWGRWVGMSYDGEVVTGWGAMARTSDEAHEVAQNLVDSGKPYGDAS